MLWNEKEITEQWNVSLKPDLKFTFVDRNMSRK